jgi:alkylation response protein AidB-like acyl-CoA dehydrogenase
MDFQFSVEEDEVKNRLAPLLDSIAIREAHEMERADVQRLGSITRSFLKKLAETDYLSLGLGPGSAAGGLKLLAAQEEIARISGSLFLAVETGARLFGGLLQGFGAGRFSDLLERLVQGDLLAAVAISEKEPAPSGPGFSTRAWRDGSVFSVSGAKAFVTNAPMADYIAVATSEDGKPAFVLIRPDQPGVTVGPRLETLGYNGLAVASLTLDEVKVPEEMVLGPFENGTCLDFLGRTQDMLLVIASVGLMRRTVAEAKNYADSHQRGGKPIFHWQEIRFKIAEMLTLTQTAQLLCHRAAWMCSVSHEETGILIHCAKVFTAESSERVASLAMQILAGNGYLSGNPVEQAYREAKYGALAGTTTEIARMSIADELLKDYQV